MAKVDTGSCSCLLKALFGWVFQMRSHGLRGTWNPTLLTLPGVCEHPCVAAPSWGDRAQGHRLLRASLSSINRAHNPSLSCLFLIKWGGGIGWHIWAGPWIKDEKDQLCPHGTHEQKSDTTYSVEDSYILVKIHSVEQTCPIPVFKN